MRFRSLRIQSAVFLSILAAASGSADDVAVRVPSGSPVNLGEILLGELNCTACHLASPAAADRLMSRAAPQLGTNGLRLTPQWIRTWLAGPSASKPGTPMPDLLHGVPEAKRADAIEALTHFLVSIQPPGPAAGLSADPARAVVGQKLYHTLGCAACHAPFERGDATAEVLARATENAIPLGDLARKYPAGEMARFLRDPAAHRSSGRMPSLNLTETEAADLAVYLLREQMATAAVADAAPVAGLKWDYYETHIGSCAAIATLTPTSSGTTDRLNAGMAGRKGDFGLRFTGSLEIATAGEYRFWGMSDDGSQLRVDDKMIVDNDGDHGAKTVEGQADLSAGFHAFEVLFYQSGGGFEFSVEWAGPGFTRQSLPQGVLKHFARPMIPLGHKPFTANPALAARGREWFTQLNCSACHVGTGLPSGRSAPALADLRRHGGAGCLADTVPDSAPRFHLSGDQRTALRTALTDVDDLETPAPPALAADLTLTRLNCYACHSRDGVGGPMASGHSEWFQGVGEVDLGDEGRIPPALTGAGAKLKPEWMAHVLKTGAKVRPYMATRMPVFGATNLAQLPAVLRAADRKPDAPSAPPLTERDAKFGWKLVGIDGLGCIACHNFAQYRSLGVPALGLDTMGERLEWDWFHRYLPDPASLRPGTRMPTFWPEGHAANDTILGGNPDAQIQAIWAYLAAGDKAEVPSGLVRGQQELVPENEPLIYRNFIAGAGSRAIGVGYPEKVNLAFDAETVRPALIWQGSFIDGARHSTGRGEGFEPPLGDHQVALPEGPSLAVLAEADDPWPSQTGHAAGYKFLGYRFDANRRPVFRYSFNGISVEESFDPKPGEVDMTLLRTLRFSGSAPGTVWFRAASGSVKPGPDGTWILGDSLRLRLRGSGEPRLVRGELRVPVSIPGELTEEMTW